MTTLIALAALASVRQSTNIQNYVQRDFRDASMVARIITGNQRELRKINDDFGQSYRFQTTTIRLKEPFKARLEAKVEDTTFLYIVNGATQTIRVPRMHVNSRQNLADKPGRRQTFLDFGLLTPSLFTSFFDADFVRNDRATGDVVFDITFAGQEGKNETRYRVWIDPQKHYVAKREWYDRHDRLKATFFYENPQEYSGVWLPTRMTVRNVDNQVAGVTAYEAVKVNTGLSDDLFNG